MQEFSDRSAGLRTIGSSIVFFFFLVVGCGGGSNQPSHSVNDVVTVSEQASCEALVQDSCRAGFGFAIDSQGNFTAGPSPTGKVVQGKITSDELASLKSSLSAVLASSHNGMTCTSVGTIPGIGENIKAAFTDSTQANLVTLQSNQLCFLGGTTNGQAFENIFQQLLIKYYPMPFPS